MFLFLLLWLLITTVSVSYGVPFLMFLFNIL